MQKKHIYFFIGTTAELIKLAPVIKELKKRKVQFKIIASGQNQVHFNELSSFTGNLQSDITLEKKKDKSSALLFIVWSIKTLVKGLLSLRREFHGLNKNNAYFIVHGDTVSALIGSIIAKVYNLRLAHVESGLYSFNLLEPFPEEFCRRTIDRLADVLFLSNKWAEENVKNLAGKKINHKENTLIESYLWFLKLKPIRYTVKNIKNLKKYYILIMHRQEHALLRKNWSKDILKFVISNSDSNLNCVLLKHPLTIDIIHSIKPELGVKKIAKITETPRIPYPNFMKLMKNAQFIATDSCINQLEAYYMGLPCLALRDRTEQPEGVGKNVLICKGNKISIKHFLTNYKKYKTRSIPLKDSARPSKIIVDYLLTH